MSKRSRAIAKLKPYDFGKYREWGGYLTPSDVLELVAAGYRPMDSLEYVVECKRRGDSRPTWFYFYR